MSTRRSKSDFQLKHVRTNTGQHEGRLPDLSGIRINDESSNMHHTAPVSSEEYDQSEDCPDPADAGNLHNAVLISPGPSGELVDASVFTRSEMSEYPDSEMSEYPDDQVEMAQTVEKDWKLGQVTLNKPTTFVHVASKIPGGLVLGSRLRSANRLYAHTDVEKWEWNGRDRVTIDWPAGLPYQIMGGLDFDSGPQRIHMRSCRYLKPDTNIPSADKILEGGWPYAHVAVVLPPAYFTVTENPIQTPTPQEVFLGFVDSEDSDMRERVAVKPESDGKFVFETTREADILKLEYMFMDQRSADKFQLYKTERSYTVQQSGRKRMMSSLGRQFIEGVVDDPVLWQLSVKTLAVYHGIRVEAHAIDMSGWIEACIWTPQDLTFQAVAKNVPVVISEELLPLLYCLTLAGKINTIANLFSYASLNGVKYKYVDNNIHDKRSLDWSSIITSSNVNTDFDVQPLLGAKRFKESDEGGPLHAALRACIALEDNNDVFLPHAQEMLLAILHVQGVDLSRGGVLRDGGNPNETVFDYLIARLYAMPQQDGLPLSFDSKLAGAINAAGGFDNQPQSWKTFLEWADNNDQQYLIQHLIGVLKLPIPSDMTFYFTGSPLGLGVTPP